LVAFLLTVAGAAWLAMPAAGGGRPPEPAALPLPEQFARASAFAADRAGVVSFAVLDTAGRLHCHGCHRRYVSASVVKAMILVAYLRGLGVAGKPLSASDRALLGPMIRASDNDAATSVFWRAGGSAALYRLARAAGMSRFDVYGYWGSAMITAADQARFLWRIDRLTPSRFRAYTRSLLSSIVPWQSWGIPTVARPRWSVLFKGGWRETALGQLVHQVALLEQGRWRMAIAVLTDGNPSHASGGETVTGITSALLGGTSSPARPWPLPVPRWFWVWARWYLHQGEFRDLPFRSRTSRPANVPDPMRDWAWRRLAAFP
jgi:Beta-lactamase enzyme family